MLFENTKRVQGLGIFLKITGMWSLAQIRKGYVFLNGNMAGFMKTIKNG